MNPTYINELLGLGSHSTPTTVIEQDGKRTVLIGFDPGRLSAALGL